MAYDFSHLSKGISETHEWFEKELAHVRTGRAAPQLLDSVMVESYGARVPINQVANVGVEDARTLRISPYDPSQVKEIEKAITVADLGVSVSSDDAGARVSFPELTGERREMLAKLIKDKLEEARIRVKNAREDTWNEMQKKEKDGDLSKDEKFTYKDEMQKLVDDANKALEERASKKEEEIRN